MNDVVGRWVIHKGELGRVIAVSTGRVLVLWGSGTAGWVSVEDVLLSMTPHERETFRRGSPVGGRFHFTDKKE